MRPEESAECAAENIEQTYLAIGSAVPGARIQRMKGITTCTSADGHPIANFALVRKVSLVEAKELADIAKKTRAFKVYVLPAVPQFEFGKVLAAAGFRSTFSLVQMSAAGSPIESDTDLLRAASDEDRLDIARFMASLFFGRAGQRSRELLARATASSGLELYEITRAGARLGGVMVSISRCSYGVYNLCIAPADQGRGYGASAVRGLLQKAWETGLTAMLQCDAELAPWYERLGFSTTTVLDIYSLDRG